MDFGTRIFANYDRLAATRIWSNLRAKKKLTRKPNVKKAFSNCDNKISNGLRCRSNLNEPISVDCAVIKKKEEIKTFLITISGQALRATLWPYLSAFTRGHDDTMRRV